MSSRRRVLSLALAAFLAPGAVSAEPVIQIAAASDLSVALPEIIEAFRKRTGRSVRAVYGPSPRLVEQILKGASYEVLLAADERYVTQLDKAGKAQNSGALYGIGRIGLFLPKDSKVKSDGRLRDLVVAARDGRLQRLAVINPEAGPYGVATREALQKMRVWMPLQSKLVLGETSSGTTQTAISGTVQAAILPYSLSLSPKVQAAGSFTFIPAELHKPLRQRAVVLKGGTPGAEAFYRFLRDPEARTIFRRNGFILPGGR